MKSKAYRATRVNEVKWDEIARGREGLGITLGVDVGKPSLLAVCRWADGRFERHGAPTTRWRFPAWSRSSSGSSVGRKLVVAMESSGTYGDCLRQALADNEIKVERVSNKASHDYAEVFDGVPSQHDGKDAAVIAELAALGKATPWDYQPADAWEQELAYWVEWMVAHRQTLTIWQGRLEGLVARHWPEATQVLKLSSATLLRALKHYGSPQALAADPKRRSSWPAGVGGFLSRRRSSNCWLVPVRAWAFVPAEWQQRQIRDYAQEALAARAEGQRAERQLRRLAAGTRGAPSPRKGGGRARRRVCCGRARGTRGSIMRPPPTARRWD